MKLEPIHAFGFTLSDIPDLDPIHVLFRDVSPGAGHLIVTCYNQAWTTYWGAMGDRGIRAFVAGCDVGYLTQNLLWNLKTTKSDVVYVRRIAEAVIEGCKVGA